MSEDKAVEPAAVPEVSEDIKMKSPCSENKYKWSDRQVELLISEWAREPCLYDTSHEDYSKSDKRLSVEQRIVAAINENVCSPGERVITVTDLKKKMNGLRTYHRTLWKKNDIGTTDEITPSWQYYEQLMFLNDHFQPRETMATISKRKLEMDDTETPDDEEDKDDKKTEFAYISSLNSPAPSTKSRRMWKRSKEGGSMKDVSTARVKKEKSAEMLFGELVGHSLKNIQDERTREYAKLQIQQILFKCRYPETDPKSFSPMQPTSSVEELQSPTDYTGEKD